MPPRNAASSDQIWYSPRTGKVAGTPTRSNRLLRVTGEVTLVAIGITILAALVSTATMKRSDEPPRARSDGMTGLLLGAVALSPDGQTLAWCAGPGELRLWQLDAVGAERELDPLSLPSNSVPLAVAFSPDGTLLAAVGHECLAIWSREEGRYVPLIRQDDQTYRCLAFSSSGRALALGNNDGTLSIREMPSGREKIAVLAHHQAVHCVAFSPDERHLVTSGQDRQVVVWDATSGKMVRQLSQPGPNPVQLVAFSPDGRSVAVGEHTSNAEDIVLVDPETGVVQSRLRGQETGTCALAFSPDGHTLASASLDRRITLWDLKSGKAETTIKTGVGDVRSLAFSRDSALLAFAGSDQSVRIWDINRLRWSYIIGRTALKA
jgi:WD40 repeat protein